MLFFGFRPGRNSKHHPIWEVKWQWWVPWTLNNLLFHGCLVISKNLLNKDLVHHPTERTIKKWMFRVPGNYEWKRTTWNWRTCLHPASWERKNEWPPIIFKRCSWKMGILHYQPWSINHASKSWGPILQVAVWGRGIVPPASSRTCANKSGSPHSSAKRKRCSTSRFFSSMGINVYGKSPNNKALQGGPLPVINGVSHNSHK